ncbi:MAG: Ig-like domain-containing protein [Cyclobacteriaceae bacterium]
MKRIFYFFGILFLVLHATASFSQNQPTNHVTGFTVSTVSDTELQLNWTDAVAGAEAPEFYLIVGRELPGGTFPAVADGPEVPADADWSNGNFAAIIAYGGSDVLSVTGLNPETEYEFSIYPYQESGGNANYKIASVPTQSGFTYSISPGGHSTVFTATLNGDIDIDLSFDAASTLTDADGYVLYRRSGSAASLTGLNDGATPPATLGGSTTLVYTTNNSETTYSDTGLDGGVTYHYVLVPFNYDGANNETFVYLTNGAEPRASESTNLIISITPIVGGGIAGNPLSSGSSNEAILGFSLTTNGPTTLDDLNIDVTTTPTGKFLNPRIFKSTNATYGGDVSINSGTLTATQLQFSGIGDVLAAGTTNYFIVVNVNPAANGSTPAIQPFFTEADISFTSPTGTAQTVTVTGLDYSFIDASPPTVSAEVPVNGAIGVSVLLTQLSITFNENVAYVGDNSNDANRIRIWDDDANSFVETIDIVDVSVAGSLVTMTTNYAFNPNTNYDVVIGNSVFEDLAANPFAGIAVGSWEFQTEDYPFISGMSDGTVCIGDQLTITGARFTGTGGTGNTKPFVFVNGVQVPPADITAFSSSSITLTVSVGSTGNVTVENQDNLLTSNGNALTVHPQINTGISVSPATLTPAQNTNVDISLSPSQSSSYSYALILTAAPGAYSEVPPSTVDTQSGNSGTQTLNTSASADDLDVVGDYTYRIDVSRTGCTTRTLSNTPFTLTVAALSVNVSATDASVCIGSSTTLIGAATGGTGFYQFRWTSTPPGYSSSSSSPTVSPTSNIRYNLELEDNAGNIVNDFIDIVVNPLPTANIVPAPLESVVRTNYTLENRNYQLYGSPAGGVFSGQGVTLLGDGNYYFNPLSATVGLWPIVYTYTDGNGCSGQDTENFIVNTAAINNLDLLYCRNSSPSTPLITEVNLSPNSTFPAAFQFTRLVFYRQQRYSPYSYCIAESAPTFSFCGLPNPLTVTGSNSVPDIQAGVTLPAGTMFNQPTSYSLNLDVIRNNYGYSTDNWFYILAYGKDANGNETYRTFQYFDVFDNGPVPSILGINEGQNVCADDPTINLSSTEPGYTISTFGINPGAYSGSLSGTNNKDFNPGHSSLTGADEIPLTIHMDYSDFNNCPNRVTRNFNWVKKPLAPTAPDVSYCKITSGGAQSYTINATPNGSASNPYWYELDPVSNPTTPVIDSLNFIGFVAPGITGLVATAKNFYVTQNYKGCEGSVEVVQIEIREAPTVSITPDPICEDRDFIIRGPEESPGVPYEEYHWTFGDGQSTTILNDSTISHNYGPGTGSAPFTIGLTIKNSLNCFNSATIPVTVGLNPKPDFTYNFICDGDYTKFNATTDIAINQAEWDFGDLVTIPRTGIGSPAPEGGTVIAPEHNFTNGPGVYPATVTTYTSSGCYNSKTKNVTILEFLHHTTVSFYDMSTVDGGRGFWTLEDKAGNSTWEFSIPTVYPKNNFTTNAWVTNANGNYSPNEESFLNSPCLDIELVERPVVTIDFILQSDENRDGFVLEFSKDGGVNWNSLGGVNTGVNWFNTTGFFSGTIGNSAIGWSGDSWKLADNPAADTIAQARRALDNLGSLTQAERAKVRFRIAFKSDGIRELGGFAFNKFTINSRNRLLLIENFTNDVYDPNNNAFNSNTDLNNETAKIQYHLGFPQNDQYYLGNPADPSARAAYYGIPFNDQNMPRGYIDGYSEGKFSQPSWINNRTSKQSLKTSEFTLTVASLPADPSYLKVSASITALSFIPATARPVLHLAVLEKTVGDNQNVLRSLIPSALGHLLPTPINQSVLINIIDSVRIEDPTIDLSDLALVAFIQDERTHEVYQAAFDNNPTNLPTVITSTEDPQYAEKVHLYPNPANREVNIELPAAVTRETSVSLLDAQGRTVVHSTVGAGERRKTISTADLAGGVYIIQLPDPAGGLVRKKVMVVHQ